MAKTWVVIADAAGARIFSRNGAKNGLALVTKLENPKGRLKNRDIDSDRAGRIGSSKSQHVHAYTPNIDPCEHAAILFSKEIAGVLGKGRSENKFQSVVLVAPPKMLGLVKEALDKQTHHLIAATLDKNLEKLEERELQNYLFDTFAEMDRNEIFARTG